MPGLFFGAAVAISCRPLFKIPTGLTAISSDEPTLGLIIAARNRPEMTNRALRSVLKQPLISEIVDIDDGSSPALDLSWVTDPRIKLIVQPNRGASAARNAGIAASLASHLLFLDNDDRLLPWAARFALWAIHSGRAKTGSESIVVGGVLVEEPGRRPSWRRPPSSMPGEIWGMDRHLLAGGRSFATKQAAIVPRVDLEAVGGWDENLRTRTTSELFMRLTSRFAVTGYRLPIYCLNRGSHPKLTQHRELRQESANYIREKHAELLSDPARSAVFEENHQSMMRRMSDLPR